MPSPYYPGGAQRSGQGTGRAYDQDEPVGERTGSAQSSADRERRRQPGRAGMSGQFTSGRDRQGGGGSERAGYQDARRGRTRSGEEAYGGDRRERRGYGRGGGYDGGGGGGYEPEPSERGRSRRSRYGGDSYEDEEYGGQYNGGQYAYGQSSGSRYGGDPYADERYDDERYRSAQYGDNRYGRAATPPRSRYPAAAGWSPPQRDVPGRAAYRASSYADEPEARPRAKTVTSLGVVAALLLLTCGGGAYAVTRLIAPVSAAGQFCADLQAQNATAAYGMLSATLRAQVTQAQFSAIAQALDQIEGRVTGCSALTSGNISQSILGYRPSHITATVTLGITRATAGALQGSVNLVKESGAWRVDTLDTALLGANLDALAAIQTYCTAMQAQDYKTVYDLLGSQLQAIYKAAEYKQIEQWHDQIDGKVHACGLASIGTGNRDASASLTISLARDKAGTLRGALGLDLEGGAWKIDSIDIHLRGTDLGGLRVIASFCSDIGSGNYAGAWGLLSANGKGSSTETQFASAFSGSATGVKWGTCVPDATTFRINGSNASVNTTFPLTSLASGHTAQANVTLWSVDVKGTWEVDNLRVNSITLPA